MSDSNKELLDKINSLNSGKPADAAVQGVAVTKAPTMELTIGQLAKAVETNPEHPVAKACSKALHTLPSHTKVSMERIDVQALLENKDVKMQTGVEEFEGQPRNVITKSLGQAMSTSKAREPVLKS